MKRLLSVGTFLLLISLVWITRSDSSSVNTTTIYNTAGVEQSGEHIVIGTANLAAGTVTITLSGKAIFSSSSSFQCGVSDMTGVSATSVIRNSGSSVTFNGLLTDTMGFICVGN
jgi:hypothetical protein